MRSGSEAGLPVIAITMGDPAGIGSEIILKTLSDNTIYEICKPVVIGDCGILSDTSDELGIDKDIISVNSPEEVQNGKSVYLISIPGLKKIKRGVVSEEAGRASGLYIEKGVELVSKGEADALVTAPINKESFNRGGYPYPGHTEYLAHLTGSEDYAMMLMGSSLKVVLLTIHCPLMEVSSRLSPDETLRIIRLASDSLTRYFGIGRPKLALAALNPHAGEGELFGKEEKDILLPAATAARDEGIDVTDPLPSDTLFYKAVKGSYDAVICPYHDQGLIPLKLLHFDDGVNVTLGLPIIRTSPDHGTAFDIAGKGLASTESLKAAIKSAAHMANIKRGEKRSN